MTHSLGEGVIVGSISFLAIIIAIGFGILIVPWVNALIGRYWSWADAFIQKKGKK